MDRLLSPRILTFSFLASICIALLTLLTKGVLAAPLVLLVLLVWAVETLALLALPV
jgi:tetrahydromethanopterin S-methyltransferase subunit E